MKIASLLPSSTEIVCALGRGSDLVGRSHECDFPADVEKLPVLTEARRSLGRTSGEIDRTVKTILEEGLAIYRVFPDRLREAAPDVVLTQIQCEVCAVSPRDVEEALVGWTGEKPRLVSLSPNRLEDVFEDIRRVAEAIGALPEARDLVEDATRRMRAVEETARGLGREPRVLMVEWIEPPMAAGNWMPRLVSMAGGLNLIGEDGRHSPWMDWEAVVRANPEKIVMLPCGFGIPRIREEMAVLRDNPAWNGLDAVKRGEVYVTDGNQYFNRPGPRLVESLEILAEIFHPGHFSFGHEGSGWVRHSP